MKYESNVKNMLVKTNYPFHMRYTYDNLFPSQSSTDERERERDKVLLKEEDFTLSLSAL